MSQICVYCGSSCGLDQAFAESAERLAQALLQRKAGLIYGGAQIGLMGVVANAVIAGGGKVVGVIPESLCQDEICHDGLSRLEVVPSMHARKERMIALADGLVALPGGLGTLEELFEALTWSQLNFHSKPCGLLNVRGYFDYLLEFMDHSVEQGFMKREHRNLLIVDSDPVCLVDAILKHC